MLKNRIKISLGVAGFLAIAASSCQKIDEFGNTNQNPGSTTNPVTPGLLTNSINVVAYTTPWDQGGTNTSGGLYCQYFTETQYTETSRYSKNLANFDNYYVGVLYNLQTIINYNSDSATKNIAAGPGQVNGSNNNQIAVARILKAYMFWYMTDLWGDIPYSSALKGDNGIVAYDAQQTIYASLFKELNEAVAQFDDGQGPKGDILFNGNVEQWKKFANSIHAIMALRLSKVDAATGKTEFNKALTSNGGVFETASGALVSYPDANFPNPVFNYYNVVKRKDYAVTKVIVDQLNSYNDRRLSAYASSTIGFPYGLTRDDATTFSNANTNWARVLKGDKEEVAAPLYILSSAQVYLARAEAASLGWTTESVATMYRSGLVDSWKQWGVYADGTNFTTYYAQDNIALGTGVGGSDLQKICTQEWLADYPNGAFGWANWRRTSYPALTPAQGTGLAIPRRLAYGLSEASYNTKNYQNASNLYTAPDGANSQYGRIWWDK